jgi:hemoglobin
VQRLAAYWGEAWGGPADFTAAMGDHSHVLRLHAGNGEHTELGERAQRCFALALDDAGVPDEALLRSTLTDYFRWATAELARHPRSADHVPPDLRVPRWSWQGLRPET